ncbi:hypothetical protein FB45DRAFT_909604 [Roridomyces roridus]|uniref:Uncharacterized protein n=1 Tax=Roridomyces roridus TaxID=1738132 RepID=A0AAD7FR67_9AGAR|nr:hypothetical protein FB45DRAFT_909604 [Roridomyces roridus]
MPSAVLRPTTLDAPWPTIDVAAKSAAYAVHHHVLLVLGAPSAHALAPILRSPTFARSLLLLVTQEPPPLSALAHARPTIKILRLDAPLVPGTRSFALSLVQVLDSAAAVARAWPGTSNTIEQLAQDETGVFTIHEPLTPDSLSRPAPTHRKSRLSASSLDNSGVSSFTPPSPRKRPSIASLSFSKPHKRARTLGTPFSSSSRPFDAVISFLPPRQPERAVFKQVILTSALATPFVAGGVRARVHEGDSELLWSPPSPSYSRPSSAVISRTGSFVAGAAAPELPISEPSPTLIRPAAKKRRSRFSLFGGSDYSSTPASRRASSVSVFASAPGPFNPAYILHVLPSSYRSTKLEGALGGVVASASAGAADEMGKMPYGYVLAERAMKNVECVLVGALEGVRDVEDGQREEEEDTEVREEAREDPERGRRRSAWIGGVLNVVTPPEPPLPRMAAKAVESENGEHNQVLFGLTTPPESGEGDEEEAEWAQDGGLASPPASPDLGEQNGEVAKPNKASRRWAIWR